MDYAVRKGLIRLWNALPALLLMTFVEVIITFCMGFLVMVELSNPLVCAWGSAHPRVVLWVAVLTAVGTQFWLLYNHKLRQYINSRSME